MPKYDLHLALLQTTLRAKLDDSYARTYYTIAPA